MLIQPQNLITFNGCVQVVKVAVKPMTARVKFNGRYGIVNVNLTCSFRCDFEFSLVCTWSWVWVGACPSDPPQHKITKEMKVNTSVQGRPVRIRYSAVPVT